MQTKKKEREKKKEKTINEGKVCERERKKKTFVPPHLSILSLRDIRLVKNLELVDGGWNERENEKVKRKEEKRVT